MGCCGLDFATDLTDKRPFIAGMVQSRDELKKFDSKWDFKKRVLPLADLPARPTIYAI